MLFSSSLNHFFKPLEMREENFFKILRLLEKYLYIVNNKKFF